MLLKMKITEVKEILNAEILNGDENTDKEVFAACGSDLMSDVLAFMKDRGLLLTGLVNPQVIRTAEMMDMCAVAFVRGKKPDQSIIDLAEQKEITLLTTDMPLYVACGRLYQAGLRGKE